MQRTLTFASAALITLLTLPATAQPFAGGVPGLGDPLFPDLGPDSGAKKGLRSC